MIKQYFQKSDLCLLPYPGGKTFAFTIIDDTDSSTLETIRPIYDCLFELGMPTTKTVWVQRPGSISGRPCDAGDTLERPEYTAYISQLQWRGFEIALHNVSSGPNSRSEICAGIERFREILGEYPIINVQHEKSLENIYFQFAQSGKHLPHPFQSKAFQRLHRLVRPARPEVATNHRCSGEDPESPYFWGDVCRDKIRYVRTNVFFRDLNTLKCSPAMPYRWAETPHVNRWFDSSNGQDVQHFNAILGDGNITRLRKERGCAILYTHFGKGFVREGNGTFELNETTKDRLRAIAGHPDGWYAPVSSVLDRLLAFQGVTMSPLTRGAVIVNHNDFDIPAVTLLTNPWEPYCDLEAHQLTADANGRLVIPLLPAAGAVVLLPLKAFGDPLRWNQGHEPAWLHDCRKVMRKLYGGLVHYA